MIVKKNSYLPIVNTPVISKSVKWEWRVFWTDASLSPIKSPITSLEEDFLILMGQEKDIFIEENDDTYILIPGCNTNIKFRDQSVSIKPIHTRAGMLNSYSKKINFDFPIKSSDVCLITGIPTKKKIKNSQDFLDFILYNEPKTKIINIEKIRLNSKFIKPDKTYYGTKKMKAEFSTLVINKNIFHTFCIESKSKKWLQEVIQKITIKNGLVMDYIDFLSCLAKKEIHNASSSDQPCN